eukprot:scaffold272235_cov19-Tisochrysis_lutea.AAC.1
MQATLQFYLECVVTTLQCSLPAMGAGATQDLDCNVKEAQGIPKSSHLKKHSCQLLHNSRRPGVGQDGFKGEKNHTANQSFWSPCQAKMSIVVNIVVCKFPNPTHALDGNNSAGYRT